MTSPPPRRPLPTVHQGSVVRCPRARPALGDGGLQPRWGPWPPVDPRVRPPAPGLPLLPGARPFRDGDLPGAVRARLRLPDLTCRPGTRPGSLGVVASTGDPRPWTPRRHHPGAERGLRVRPTQLGFLEWYYPSRLSIDAGAAASLQQTAVANALGLRLLHTAEVDVPLYAFQTSLGGRTTRWSERPRVQGRVEDPERDHGQPDVDLQPPGPAAGRAVAERLPQDGRALARLRVASGGYAYHGVKFSCGRTAPFRASSETLMRSRR